MFYEQIQSEVYCESGTSFIHVINTEHVIHNSVISRSVPLQVFMGMLSVLNNSKVCEFFFEILHLGANQPH